MIPIDPIMALVVVVGVFVYFALKGNGKEEKLPPNKMRDGSSFSEWYMELCEKNRRRNEERLEEIRYEKWLVEHQQ